MNAPSRSRIAGYLPGYLFFTHAPGIVSDGIGWFERYEHTGKAPVWTHTGIVIWNGDCVEAHWQHGVQRARLSKYLNDPATAIAFRRPQGWTPELGARLASMAMSRIGTPYDKGLILSQFMAHTVIGHWLNLIFRGAPDRWASRILANRSELICSELDAWALNRMPEFHGRGCLQNPIDTISPQILWDDQVILEPTERRAKVEVRPLAGENK